MASTAAGSAASDATSEKTAALQKLARHLHCLSDSDRNKRRRGLQAINAFFFEDKEVSTAVAVSAFQDETFHRPLVSALADSNEGNREQAITLLRSFLTLDSTGQCHAVTFPLALTYLTARVGKTPFPEDSEEIRLLLAQLLNCYLAQASSSSSFPLTSKAIAEAAEIIKALSSDSFHTVKVEASLALQHLSAAAPSSLHLQLSTLVASQLPNLTHQRAPVRAAALDALKACLPCGAEGLPRIMSEQVLPALRGLRYDRTASVRRQLASTAGLLLGHMHAQPAVRAASEVQLCYMLLSLLGDEAAEVGEQAYVELEAAANAAASTSASASKEAGGAAAALPADLQAAAEAASGTETAAVAGATSSPHAPAAISAEAAMSLASQLPPPFHAPLSRITQGCSPAVFLLVQRLYPQLLQEAILPELKDWTTRSRVSAAAALRSLLLLLRSASVPLLSHIIAALCSGSKDEEQEVRKLLGDTSRLLGVFVPVQAQLEVLLPQLQGKVSGLISGEQHAAALAVLSTALASMGQQELLAELPALAATLALPHLAEDEPLALRHQLARAAAAAVFCISGHSIMAGKGKGAAGAASSSAGAGESSSSSLPLSLPASSSALVSLEQSCLDNLIVALLAGENSSAAPEADVTLCESAFLRLAHCQGFHSAASLLAERAKALLQRLTGSVGSWSKASQERRLFETLLRRHRSCLCGSAAGGETGLLVRQVIEAFAACLLPSKEADLRVAMLALLDSFIQGTGGAAAAAAATAASASADTVLSSSAAAADMRAHSCIALASPPSAGGDKGGAASAAAASDSSSSALSTVLSSPASFDKSLLSSTPQSAAVCEACVDAALAAQGDILLIKTLLPNAVWRVGMVAATLRKVSFACIATALRRRLLPAAEEPFLSLLAELLPLLKGGLGDDDAVARLVCVQAVRYLLREFSLRKKGGSSAAGAAGASSSSASASAPSPLLRLDGEHGRTLYPELLKRLDDSNDAVRTESCAALSSLCQACSPEDFSAGPSQYMVEALLVHLDDTDRGVQQAVYRAILAVSAASVQQTQEYAVKQAKASLNKHRSPALCQQLIEELQAVRWGTAGSSSSADGGAAVKESLL